MQDCKWIVLYDSNAPHIKLAAAILATAISEQTGHPVPLYYKDEVTEERYHSNNLIFIGLSNGDFAKEPALAGKKIPDHEQGYYINVCDNPAVAGKQAVFCLGFDPLGTLYGVMDFQTRYLQDAVYANSPYKLVSDRFYAAPFCETLPAYECSDAPAILTRGIWTWGHCIYDYRAFFQVMLSLKLNQIVIWNDFAPINAKEIVACAHSFGIEVIWGFSWGWNTDCQNLGFEIDNEETIREWAAKICQTYERDYADTGADGIYFQTFTETGNSQIDGISIAHAAVCWVNKIADTLLKRHPKLPIQFGLHATSVADSLSELAAVDNRIRIVWEDCGAFPYAYHPGQVAHFEETLSFTKDLCRLRGEKELFGAVLKGMTTLDWTLFKHQQGPYCLGEYSRNFIKERTASKAKMWNYIQAYWLKNGDYARRMIAEIAHLTGGSCVIQGLVEDGCLEAGAAFAATLFAELLWNPDREFCEIMFRAASLPGGTLC